MNPTTNTPAPTGRIALGEDGARDLILVRSFRAPIEDVWASITESERTARWFASWTGEPGVGRTIRFRMTHEGDDIPESEMTIQACEPPRHLAVTAVDDHGSWHLEATLTEDAGNTVLRFVQHLEDTSTVGEVGPGWEYYLDMLVATHTGDPQPDFDDYYPAQKSYFESQV